MSSKISVSYYVDVKLKYNYTAVVPDDILEDLKNSDDGGKIAIIEDYEIGNPEKCSLTREEVGVWPLSEKDDAHLRVLDDDPK